MPDKPNLESLSRFIREHRNNESNFSVLYQRLEAEAAAAEKNGQKSFAETLREIGAKQADVYRQAHDAASGAWPEFENFASAFEKAVLQEVNGVR